MVNLQTAHHAADYFHYGRWRRGSAGGYPGGELALTWVDQLGGSPKITSFGRRSDWRFIVAFLGPFQGPLPAVRLVWDLHFTSKSVYITCYQ
jgi:hypothetical protein